MESMYFPPMAIQQLFYGNQNSLPLKQYGKLIILSTIQITALPMSFQAQI